MPRLPLLQVSFALFLVWESSCQKKQVVVPLTPTPVASPAPAPEAEEAPAPTPATTEAPAPTTTTPAPTTSTHPAQDSSPYQVNKPPVPAPAAKKPVRAAAPPQPAPAATPAPAPPVPPAPAPKLGDVLTSDEQKQYSASIDQSLSQAQASLNFIGTRQLNKDQQAEVEQIKNFMQHAQSTRASDPAGAKSLAERAEVLARDLAASFR